MYGICGFYCFIVVTKEKYRVRWYVGAILEWRYPLGGGASCKAVRQFLQWIAGKLNLHLTRNISNNYVHGIDLFLGKDFNVHLIYKKVHNSIHPRYASLCTSRGWGGEWNLNLWQDSEGWQWMKKSNAERVLKGIYIAGLLTSKSRRNGVRD